MISDDDQVRISAFLDGEMTADERGAFQLRLEREPALQKQMQNMVRVDEQLREVVGRINQHPLAGGLSQTLKPEPGSDSVEKRLRRSRSSARRWLPEWPQAIAASVLIAFGVSIYLNDGSGTVHDDDVPRVDPGPNFLQGIAHWLNSAPSGRAFSDGDQWFEAQFSFVRWEDGVLCRQYSLVGEKANHIGIACRENDGWRLVARKAAGVTGENERLYRPAGAPQSALSSYIEAHIDGIPLDAENEASYLASP